MNSAIVPLPPRLLPAHCLQDSEERVVADGQAQGVQRHRAAQVDGAVEEVVGPGIADDERPERIVGGDPA